MAVHKSFARVLPGDMVDIPEYNLIGYVIETDAYHMNKALLVIPQANGDTPRWEWWDCRDLVLLHSRFDK